MAKVETPWNTAGIWLGESWNLAQVIAASAFGVRASRAAGVNWDTPGPYLLVAFWSAIGLALVRIARWVWINGRIRFKRPHVGGRVCQVVEKCERVIVRL
jgi:hypothetical protein